jgi:hypothetical protein
MTGVQKVSKFLQSTRDIFCNPAFSDGPVPICRWDEDGMTIRILDVKRFESEVLPKYFGHENFASFVRQLNMYDFHKASTDKDELVWRGEYFKRDYPEVFYIT